MRLVLQILDVDYILANGKPIIRIFGKTKEGNSVCIYKDNFLPYMYVKTNKDVLKKIKNTEIVRIEEVERFTPIGYSSKPKKMFKIVLKNPQKVPEIRMELQKHGIKEIYESDILFKYRFLVDYGIKGMQWIEADVERVFTHTTTIPTFKAKNIKTLNKIQNAPLKFMTIDIESIQEDMTRGMDATKDEIILISLCFTPEYKGKNHMIIVAKQVNGNDVIGCDGEKEMLEKFVEILHDYDPDILIGYNILGFDLPFIIERLKIHEIPCFLGRTKDKQTFVKKIGSRYDCQIVGRVVVDAFQIIKSDVSMKFMKYTLDNVAKELLNEEKENVSYKEIPKLWRSSGKEFNRLLNYAKKDAILAMKLVLHLHLINKFFELSKISGLLLQDTFGGQSQRLEIMLLHEFKKQGFVMPSKPDEMELRKRNEQRKQLQGALVLEPKKGLHKNIIVLDFLSLYPNIIITFNISPDTLLTNEQADSETSPIGARFVKKSIREGILPKIAKRILEERVRIKLEMKNIKNEEKYRLLDAKQYALKILANSIYGYTGYIRARLYVLEVAASITSYGRKIISTTKNIVEKNGYDVVYGDTDSVFVKVDTSNMNEIISIGEDIAKIVTDSLPGSLELEFEKIYKSFLILTKKRYAGWVFDVSGKDYIEMKGIETIRRDWCPLVSEVLEKIINIILKENDIRKSVKIFQKVIEDLKQNSIPLEKLTVTKTITKPLHTYEGMLPHIELAKKINTRDPRNMVVVGERIGYVIIKGNEILSKRAEDPRYVIENNLIIDEDYYIQSQLLPPVRRILEVLGVEEEEIMGNGRQTSLVEKFVAQEKIPLLNSCEGFICSTCKQFYKRIPLNGTCDCGGELKIFSEGKSADKCLNILK